MVRLSPRWLVASIVLAVGVAVAGCTPGGGGGASQPAIQDPAPTAGVPGY